MAAESLKSSLHNILFLVYVTKSCKLPFLYLYDEYYVSETRVAVSLVINLPDDEHTRWNIIEIK